MQPAALLWGKAPATPAVAAVLEMTSVIIPATLALTRTAATAPVPLCRLDHRHRPDMLVGMHGSEAVSFDHKVP